MRATGSGHPSILTLPWCRGGGARIGLGRTQRLTIPSCGGCGTDHAQAHAHISSAARNGCDTGVAVALGTTRILMPAANLRVGFQYSAVVSGRVLEPP